MPFAEAQIDFTVIYSEVNQKENKVSYNIVSMWNLEKMVQMNLFAKKKKREEKKRTNLQIPTREQTYRYQQRKGWMKWD